MKKRFTVYMPTKDTHSCVEAEKMDYTGGGGDSVTAVFRNGSDVIALFVLPLGAYVTSDKS